MPRASGLSDEEVLAMFQQEELGEFDVPRELIPHGMAYGWKLKAALGKKDFGYQAEADPGVVGWRSSTRTIPARSVPGANPG